VASIVQLMKDAWENRRFERLASIRSRLHGFDPSGPTGRKMIADAQKCVEDGERKIARRNRLATLIPNELKAENYERAQTFIEEFQSLNEDPLVYNEELSEIPAKIFSRDLVRIRQCVRARDWKTARHLIESLAPKYGDQPEYQDARAAILNHDRLMKRIFWGIAISAFILLYLLAIPIFGWMAGEPFKKDSFARAVYTPGEKIYRMVGLTRAADYYFGPSSEMENEANARDLNTSKTETVAANNRENQDTDALLPEKIKSLKFHYEARIKREEESYTKQAGNTIDGYISELHSLRQEAQKLGDFNSVTAIMRALEASNAKQIEDVKPGDPERLVVIKQRYSKTLYNHELWRATNIVKVSNEYMKKLEDIKSAYTREDRLEDANVAFLESDRVKNDLVYKKAKAIVDKDPSLMSGAGIAVDEKKSIELRKKREDLLAQTRSIEEEKQLKLKDIPQRYCAALDMLQKQYMQAGSYNAVEAVMAELNRFKEVQTLKETDILSEPEDLASLQRAMIQSEAAIHSEYTTQCFDLVVAYLEALDNEKVQLTKKGRMSEAAAVDAEMRIIVPDPAFQALMKSIPPEIVPEKIRQMMKQLQPAPSSRSTVSQPMVEGATSTMPQPRKEPMPTAPIVVTPGTASSQVPSNE
jgi:hypothetical protein